MGLRETIIAIEDLDREEITIPEWKVEKAYMRELTGTEAASLAKVTDGNYHPRVVAFALLDDAGKPVFEPKDWQLLAKKSHTVIKRLAEVALALSGIGDEEEAEIKNDSGETVSEDSPTGSQFLSGE